MSILLLKCKCQLYIVIYVYICVLSVCICLHINTVPKRILSVITLDLFGIREEEGRRVKGRKADGGRRNGEKGESVKR
jgi:hypothetical protein